MFVSQGLFTNRFNIGSLSLMPVNINIAIKFVDLMINFKFQSLKENAAPAKPKMTATTKKDEIFEPEIVQPDCVVMR